jgi:methionine-rich copper-binding protein CopC
MRRTGRIFLTMGLVLGVAAAAGAHAFLARAEPRVGSTVRTQPAEVRLWFTERLEPAFSTVTVTDAAGQAVDTGDGRVDPAAPTVLRVSVPPLPPGRYTVRWRVLSVDTHVTEGTFQFTVAP